MKEPLWDLHQKILWCRRDCYGHQPSTRVLPDRQIALSHSSTANAWRIRYWGITLVEGYLLNLWDLAVHRRICNLLLVNAFAFHSYQKKLFRITFQLSSCFQMVVCWASSLGFFQGATCCEFLMAGWTTQPPFQNPSTWYSTAPQKPWFWRGIPHIWDHLDVDFFRMGLPFEPGWK